VRSIAADPGTAIMAIGEASGDRRALEATQRAVESSLLERDIRGARRILLNVTGGDDLTLMEIHETATLAQSLAHAEATIIFGTVQDPALTGMMRVTLIATGFADLPRGGVRVHPEEVAVTRPLPPHPTSSGSYTGAPDDTPAWNADVITPEQLLGDAWPLPETPASNEEPTIALPALPLRPTEPVEPPDARSGRWRRVGTRQGPVARLACWIFPPSCAAHSTKVIRTIIQCYLVCYFHVVTTYEIVARLLQLSNSRNYSTS
jgi:hypothetical protein